MPERFSYAAEKAVGSSTTLEVLRLLEHTHLNSKIKIIPFFTSKMNKEEIKTLEKWFSDKDVIEHLLPGTPLGKNLNTGKIETVSVKEWLLQLRESNSVFWKVIHPRHGFIGFSSLNAINDQQMSCERGIVIGEKQYWGEGIGKIVGEMLLEIIIENGFKKVTSSPYVANERSIPNVKRQLGTPVGSDVDQNEKPYLLFEKHIFKNLSLLEKTIVILNKLRIKPPLF